MNIIKCYAKNNNIITCFNVETSKLSTEDHSILMQLLKPNINEPDRSEYIEYGTKTSTVTPWCSNCLSILQKCGIYSVNRIEQTFLIKKQDFNPELIDSVTQTVYDKPIDEFIVNDSNDNVYDTTINETDFDPIDVNYYTNLFQNLDRWPNNVEVNDLIQTNNEHTRHFFFKGKLFKNNKELVQSLFQMVKSTQVTNNNSIVHFHDNSSVFRGFKTVNFFPNIESRKYDINNKLYHFTYTSETHNAPTGIAPFEGANTGVGGRIRDNQAVGRGGLIGGSVTGYSVGEITSDKSRYWKKNLNILVLASNGVSDYANKFGEPSLVGYCRVFGLTIGQERIEYLKPILFSGGLGQIDDCHVVKAKPEIDMLIVKLGGPAYKIGMGGGSFSSREQNTVNTNNDLNAVQRGDPEMENKLNRFIRTCVELGENNPILNINDQGAGGNANAIKEMLYPNGGIINLDNIKLGDKSMNALEIWISEYQENNVILINENSLNTIEMISKRENIDYCVIGKVNNTGNVEVYSKNNKVIDLPLEPILGDDLPRRSYDVTKVYKKLTYKQLNFRQNELLDTLKQILALPSVGSKRFLTNKIDRSVTGLVAQQQCIGPLHTPLSNYGIMAQSYFDITGCVVSVGEQPIKGLIDPGKMARLTVGEMLTNMVFAKITDIKDIKCSANWMWPIKFEGEKYNIYKACKEMCNMIKQLGFSVDRGKDSLSMSYTDHQNKETIKAPGSLVISGYAPMTNITIKITPDFKQAGSDIIFIDLGNSHMRLGGSSLLYLHDQLGYDCPDVDIDLLGNTFNIVQELIAAGKIKSGHDRSDGGLITTLCEMAFSGNLGFDINIASYAPFAYCFNEELGLVIEVNRNNTQEILAMFASAGDHAHYLGKVISDNKIKISNFDMTIMNDSMTSLRDCWEKPSFDIEKLQCNIDCANEEYMGMKSRSRIQYKINKDITVNDKLIRGKHKVAVIRDEGSNGDRELASALYSAGFEVYDLCMNDFISDESITLESFRGICFCGGFTYSDVCGSAKGWATVIKSNERIHDMFDKFRNRDDTFILGICNGCQLMCELGLVEGKLTKNTSDKFESRFPTLKINKTNSIFLKNMEDSILGCWSAHGEGRFVFDVEPSKESIAVQYVNDNYQVTTAYPFNPANSQYGVAGLISLNGRCLAMMPHPERSYLNWQIPYGDMRLNDTKTLWFKLFENAYMFCENN